MGCVYSKNLIRGETVNIENLKNIIEALLFTADKPLTVKRLQAIIENSSKDEVQNCINELKEDYSRRNGGIELSEIAGGWQFSTKFEYGNWVKKLFKSQTSYRLSRSSLETLAIIAYKQPITRAEIENVRGVDSGGILRNLLEKRVIRISGKKATIGHPLLYSTTQNFLRYFGLKDLSEMPSLKDIGQSQ